MIDVRINCVQPHGKNGEKLSDKSFLLWTMQHNTRRGRCIKILLHLILMWLGLSLRSELLDTDNHGILAYQHVIRTRFDCFKTNNRLSR